MTDISAAMKYLKENEIDAVEVGGILVIPYDYIHDGDADEIYKVISKLKGLLKDIDFNKSWMIDPYYYDKKRYEDGSVVIARDEFA